MQKGGLQVAEDCQLALLCATRQHRKRGFEPPQPPWSQDGAVHWDIGTNTDAHMTPAWCVYSLPLGVVLLPWVAQRVRPAHRRRKLARHQMLQAMLCLHPSPCKTLTEDARQWMCSAPVLVPQHHPLSVCLKVIVARLHISLRLHSHWEHRQQTSDTPESKVATQASHHAYPHYAITAEGRRVWAQMCAVGMSHNHVSQLDIATTEDERGRSQQRPGHPFRKAPWCCQRR